MFEVVHSETKCCWSNHNCWTEKYRYLEWRLFFLECFELPCQPWSTMNWFQTGQCQCAAMVHDELIPDRTVSVCCHGRRWTDSRQGSVSVPAMVHDELISDRAVSVCFHGPRWTDSRQGSVSVLPMCTQILCRQMPTWSSTQWQTTLKNQTSFKVHSANKTVIT